MPKLELCKSKWECQNHLPGWNLVNQLRESSLREAAHIVGALVMEMKLTSSLAPDVKFPGWCLLMSPSQSSPSLHKFIDTAGKYVSSSLSQKLCDDPCTAA